MKPKNKKEQARLDFEIKFYEGILKQRPNFIQALSALADNYTKRGLFDQGLAVDKQLASLRPDEPVVWYNLSCSYSLLNNIEEGLYALEKAIRLGYADFYFMEKDADLENLRKDSRFKDLILNFKKKNE